MNWQDLLNARQVQRYVTSKREIDDLRSVVQRDLQDAGIAALSADRRFATAYNAALQLSKMAVACEGYRVTSSGHHKTTFEAMEVAVGPASTPYALFYDACRRRRNILDYDTANVVSEQDAADILLQTEQFQILIESWIKQNYLGLANS